MSQPDHYCVVGNPIAHSLSPAIHAAFANATDQNLTYTAKLVPLGGLKDAVLSFRRTGGRGMNVTVPFKEDAFALADELSQRASLAGAVNTLSFQADGPVIADNTDGCGLVRDLTRNLGVLLHSENVLILGAGGATRGIIAPLHEAGVASLAVANRSIERAQQLAKDFSSLIQIDVSGLHEVDPARYSLIINASAAGHNSQNFFLEQADLGAAFCYDLSYGGAASAFLDWARQGRALGQSDGLGMLVEQAAESFRIWRGVKPATQAVITELRASQAV